MIKIKRILSTFLVVLMIISVLPFGIFAVKANDYDTSWAKTEINYMEEKGILSGYPDGTFRPGNNMTKAEFYKVINGLMGFTNKSKVNFIDVKPTHWFYREVAKGLAAKYLSNSVKLEPNSKINREEVARIIGFVFGIEKDLAAAKEFTDYDALSEASRGVIGGLKKNGFISGYPDGTFRPKSEITRAEVVKMLNNITGEIVNIASTVSKDIKANLLVNTGDVVLKDMVIEGNLYLTEGIGKGDVTLDNVEVKGELAIKGGGANFIIINNSKINRVTVDKPIRLLKVEFQNTVVEEVVNLQDGKEANVKETRKLPEIYDTGKAKIVKIPAMPEKGFKWPYLLKIPSNTYKKSNVDLPKRYLMFEMANTQTARYAEMEKTMIDRLERQQATTFWLAERLWAPVMVPLIPRTKNGYWAEKDYSDRNFFHEHGLDRDIIMLDKLLEDEFIREQLMESYDRNDYNIDDYLDFDKQILAMIDHAIDYLNQYGHKVEDKILIGGDSASGQFSSRFSTLYPERVKISSVGVPTSGIMIPATEYKGEKLIYPIGSYENEEITGKKFNLTEHNKVARLYYIGKEDDHDALSPNDTYGNIERNLIIKIFGAHLNNPLQRARNTNKAYAEVGGKGIIVYMDKTGHSVSKSMADYLLQFYRENLRSERPVYNLPKNPKGLEVEIYK